MESQKVDMFVLMNSKNYESHHLEHIYDKLSNLDDAKWKSTLTIPIKDPVMAQIISLMAGIYGIDRFYIGDTGLGIAKLLTCGGFGIWAIIDWFLIAGVARERNFESFQNSIY